MKKSAEKPLQEKFPEGVLNNKENKKNRDNESANKAVKLFNVNPHYITDANIKKEKVVGDKLSPTTFSFFLVLGSIFVSA
jgi:hypothetical protein